jgi:hypothetical protein
MIGTASDSARVEQIIGRLIAIAKSKFVRQDIVSLDKKRAFFPEKSFVCTQVYLLRISFNLAKIRINGEVHGKVIGEADFGI